MYSDDASRRSVRTSQGRSKKHLEQSATTRIVFDYSPLRLLEVTNVPEQDLISAVTTPDNTSRRSPPRARNIPCQSRVNQTTTRRKMMIRRARDQVLVEKVTPRNKTHKTKKNS